MTSFAGGLRAPRAGIPCRVREHRRPRGTPAACCLARLRPRTHAARLRRTVRRRRTRPTTSRTSARPRSRSLIQYGLMLGILLLIARGLPRRELFALRRPPSWPRALGLALARARRDLPRGARVRAASSRSSATSTRPRSRGSCRTAGTRAERRLHRLLPRGDRSSHPLVEELTYRGLGFSLVQPYGVVLAIIVTGVLFGLAHGLLDRTADPHVLRDRRGLAARRTDSIYPGDAAPRCLQRRSR